ncbi:hypothetical protein YC2023_115904 [Brassica napus]
MKVVNMNFLHNYDNIKQGHKSLLPLNEECIFENVPLVVVKMKRGSIKVTHVWQVGTLCSLATPKTTEYALTHLRLLKLAEDRATRHVFEKHSVMVGSENTSNMGWLVGRTAESKVALVYDLMNEPPRARMTPAHVISNVYPPLDINIYQTEKKIRL